MNGHKTIVIPNICFIFGYLFIALWAMSSTGAAAQNYARLYQEDTTSVFIRSNETAKYSVRWPVRAITAAGYASFTYLCYRHFDEDIQNLSQRNQSKASSVIANGLTYVGLGRFQSIALASTTITAFALHNDKLKQTVIIWATSLLMNSIVTDQLKKTFQRHRPNTGDPSNVFDWRGGPGINNSFPSAHTSNAFTTATVFATMYKDKKWVSPVAYTLAAAVGLSRIYKNAHWASDVLAGAAVGFLSAKSINVLYKVASDRLSFLPEVGYRNYSVSVVFNF